MSSLATSLDCWRISDTFKKFKVEYVFNCVGDTYVPAAYDVPRRFFSINVEGNLNLLTATKQFGVKRMLYVSSTEVYGESDTDQVSEDSALAPLNTYAVSKTASDRLCFTFHQEHGTPVVIARIFNTYGPRETEPYVIPEIITQLDKSNVLELGNYKAERDFNYVHDTARWLIDLLRSDVPDGEAVNVGSGRVYSVEWLAKAIARIMDVDDLKIVQSPTAFGDWISRGSAATTRSSRSTSMHRPRSISRTDSSEQSIGSAQMEGAGAGKPSSTGLRFCADLDLDLQRLKRSRKIVRTYFRPFTKKSSGRVAVFDWPEAREYSVYGTSLTSNPCARACAIREGKYSP